MFLRISGKGVIVKDATLKQTSEDRGYLLYTIMAKNEKAKDPKYGTSFYTCRQWVKPGSPIINRLIKGVQVFVEGRLSVTSNKSASGQNVNYTTVEVESVEILGASTPSTSSGGSYVPKYIPKDVAKSVVKSPVPVEEKKDETPEWVGKDTPDPIPDTVDNAVSEDEPPW